MITPEELKAAREERSREEFLEVGSRLQSGIVQRERAAHQTRDERQTLFFMDVATELQGARRKFPNSVASLAALTEEVGELAKAMLSESPQRIYMEAVQVAAMAVRCALEGDSSLTDYRINHQGVDAVPARGERP